MAKSPYNTLLKFLFCAFALIMLSACGGGGGAGDDEGIADGGGSVCEGNPDLPICQAATVECDPSTHFCETSGIEKATCNIATHECEGTGDGTGVQTCNHETHFCFTSRIAKATCNPATHNCGNNGNGTGERTCNPSTHFCETSRIAKNTCNALLFDCAGNGAELPCNPALLLRNCDTGSYITGGEDRPTGYEPPNTEAPPAGGWVAALAVVRTDEYHKTRKNTPFSAADQIGAAYAHARGHTGAGVVVSVVGDTIGRAHPDFTGQLVQGFEFFGTLVNSNENFNDGYEAYSQPGSGVCNN